MKVKISCLWLLVIMCLVVYLASPVLSAPLEIRFVETIDYNVTYKSYDVDLPTNTGEYPADYDAGDTQNERIPRIVGKIVISNNAQEKLSDINITIDNTYNITSLPEYRPELSTVKGYVHDPDFDWNDTVGGTIVLHIPDLPVNGYAVFNYTVNITEITEPVDVDVILTTGLEHGRIFNNEYFNVSIKVNVPDYYYKPDVLVTINTSQIAVNNFTFQNYTLWSDYMSVTEGYFATNITTNNESIHWADVVLDGRSDYAYMNHTVLTPNTTTLTNPQGYNENKNWVPMSYANLLLNFTTNDTLTPMTITHVEAVSEVDMSVSKERSSAWNWTARSYFNNPTPDLFYTLRKFTVWSTVSMRTLGEPALSNLPDPGQGLMPNSTYEWNESTDGSYPVIIGPGETWQDTDGYTFKNDTHVPLMWGKANFTLVYNSSMVNETRSTINRTAQYIYDQKVIFLWGYFLEAHKRVYTVDEEGVFKVVVNLTNKGNARTPNSTLLADLIPRGFNMTFDTATDTFSENNMTLNSTDLAKDYSNEGVTDGIVWSRYASKNFTGKSPASGAFSGDWVYFWELTPISPGESIQIEYYINGTGEFAASYLYIIGVDPVQTQRFGASRQVISGDGLSLPAEESAESALISVSLGLFAISLFSLKKRKN